MLERSSSRRSTQECIAGVAHVNGGVDSPGTFGKSTGHGWPPSSSPCQAPARHRSCIGAWCEL
eukprot:365193-Chlamydomonas_euryale.AAC.18